MGRQYPKEIEFFNDTQIVFLTNDANTLCRTIEDYLHGAGRLDLENAFIELQRDAGSIYAGGAWVTESGETVNVRIGSNEILLERVTALFDEVAEVIAAKKATQSLREQQIDLPAENALKAICLRLRIPAPTVLAEKGPAGPGF